MQCISRFFVLFLVSFCASAAQPVTVVDDAGRPVRLPAPANRIVSLAPHITELLFAAGAGDKVVGVSEFSTYPPEALQLPQIGGGAGLDLEAIVALRPDVVIAWQSGNAPGQIEKLAGLGIPVFYSEPRAIDAIASSLERLGSLAGSEARARSAADVFRQRVASLRKRYAAKSTVRVFYQIWQQPLMTVNGDHLISSWLALCGAENVFSGLPDLAPVIGIEAVLEANPQVLVAGSYEGKSSHWRELWQQWPQMQAVADNHLYTVPAELMERPTPRALLAAEQLCELIEKARAGYEGN